MENKKEFLSKEIIDIIVDSHDLILEKLYNYLLSCCNDFNNIEINRKLKNLYEDNIENNTENNHYYTSLILFIHYHGVDASLTYINNFHESINIKKKLLIEWFENTILTNLNKFNEASLYNLSSNISEVFENNYYEYQDVISVIEEKKYTKIKLLELFDKFESNNRYGKASYIMMFDGVPISLIMQGYSFNGDINIHKLDNSKYNEMLNDVKLLMQDKLSINLKIDDALLKLESLFFSAKEYYSNGQFNEFFTDTLMEIFKKELK